MSLDLERSIRRHPAGKARPAPRPVRGHHAMTAMEWALTGLALTALTGVTYMVVRVITAAVIA